MARLRDFSRASDPAAATTAPPLPCPLPDLRVALSDADLRATAYELLVTASRSTGAKPLTYIPQSAAAGKLKGAFGLWSSASSNGGMAAVLERVRVRMGITDQADARIRRALLRVAAGQIGRPAESMVWPLEFLQKCKASDFQDSHEYEAWQTRNFKLLEAGLLVHPLVPLKKSGIFAKRMQQIIHEAYDGKLETGRNSESMQRLRSAVTSLACRSLDETSNECHWADGFPLNLHIYKTLVEACFDVEGTVVEEIDETIELLKKTWPIFGVNQMLHDLYFTWALFNHFVLLGQDNDLLSATESLLAQVAKDARITKDPDYCDVLSSTLSSIMGWTEKRLLAYHETFNTGNIYSLQYIVSIGILSAKILFEEQGISNEYHSGAKGDIDVVQNRIETYIHSSLRTAFAQKMEEGASDGSSRNCMPVLSILAKKTSDIAIMEKNVYSPILKKWHPLAAGVAVATLHDCFGNELKQFIARLTQLTPDTAHVLKAADKLEKDLIHIAIEDSIDIDDGGKSLVRQMPPYEAGTVMANLVKAWVKEQVDKLKGWADKKLEHETWNSKDNDYGDGFAPSSVEILHLIEETFDAFFELYMPMNSSLLADLTAGLDKCLDYYVSKVKSSCGTQRTFFPQLPHLTRCDVGSKLFKKNEKPQFLVKRGSQVGTTNGNEASSLPGLCLRINTLHYIQSELESLDKKTKACLLNDELAQSEIAGGLNISFELSQAACQEGIRQLCETTAYMVIFNDLNHVLMDTLYVGRPASNRILPLLKELGPILKIISSTLPNIVRNRLITAVMKASFDGLLLVLLAGGPTRAFCCQDYQIIEDDFRALRGLYLTYSDGLPEELVAKASSEVKSILPLLRTDTETLIERFKKTISESYECTTKSRLPMPPVPPHWSPDNPNTILRVLCYRNDEAATKFLKKTYDLPKTL